ncbi:micronuclear linker histone polyprotein-like isoform X2 [Battus philenor]|uniref:micronuclear linker histone polyprotein-like isoform X2 n=1 Tax=Battus philenor TaxID=42288 RepID=UPI0035CEA8B4
MLMVQTNAQPMKTNKIKGPPPVPPRPSQSLVAEALAKTRKAVTDSKTTLSKSRASSKQDLNNIAKAKTLDRTYAASQQVVTPKQNGLARVKSFIKDVISDRSSSSDEKKSSGQNSRRSSSDSSSLHGPASMKRSNESLNSKAVKTCRQILVRSLSTSNKLDQDSKCKVSKSSSFAEKTLPLRKAPPPPLSPKPKLKPMKALPVNKPTINQNKQKKQATEVCHYSLPIDVKSNTELITEAPYATVDEVQEFDDRLRSSPLLQNTLDTQKINDNANSEDPNKNNSLDRKTSRVTEMLISEILASRNNNTDEANTVIDKGKDSTKLTNGNDSPEITKDMNNHEMLIYELQTMRSQSNVPEGPEDKDPSPHSELCDSDSEPNYAMCSVTSEQTDDLYEQAYAYIVDDDLKSRLRKQFRAISTMSLQGLPPLPKSLSGFAEGEPDLCESPTNVQEPPPTDLDSQLTYLKKEMASLRQLDLSLLSELWSLSEAMAAWRRQLERAPRLRPAPPPPHYLRT